MIFKKVSQLQSCYRKVAVSSMVGNSRVRRRPPSTCCSWASATLVGILLVLTSAFRSFKDALIIMLNLPLALMGGVIGVFLAGGVLSVASLIGFITLFGVATRNGIILISHIRHLMEVKGEQDYRQAVIRGAAERVSPILMTALTAGLALVPVALGLGKPGSEIQAPMAIVIFFGLLSSTARNMVVVPAMYFRFGQRAALIPQEV